MNPAKARKPGYRCLAIFCATIAIGMAAPLQASDLAGQSITVRFGDLAIDREQGASQLLKRIQSAAARICEPLDHGSLSSRWNAKKCRVKLTADAVYKVNHPMLLTVYNASRGATPAIASR